MERERSRRLELGHRQRRAVAAPRRQRAAEGTAAALQVADLGAVVGRLAEGERFGVGVAHRQGEAVAEGEQAGAVELLRLVRRHPALRRLAHGVALHRLGEHDRRLAGMGDGGGERGVDLDRVVAAAAQPIDVLVAQVGDQRLQLLVLAEEDLAVEGAVLGREGLELAVDGLREGAHQGMAVVAREQHVPVARPEALHHVPAGAGEHRLELVDDPAVAAHRAVEALQVAVDDEGAVVELLARRQRERGDRLGLVHLAVAEEAPDPPLRRPLRRRQEAAMGEVAHEARLVDRVDRADAHRAGGELPEVRHQLRMRIRGQAARAVRRGAQLLAVVGEVVGAEAALEEGAGVDAGRGVRLEEDQVAERACGPHRRGRGRSG